LLQYRSCMINTFSQLLYSYTLLKIIAMIQGYSHDKLSLKHVNNLEAPRILCHKISFQES